MEAIKHFFQDASNACAYANECAPDFSVLKPHEPFSALLAVSVGCFFLWAWNERRIASHRAAAAKHDCPTAGVDDLKVLLGAMKSEQKSAEKIAA